MSKIKCLNLVLGNNFLSLFFEILIYFESFDFVLLTVFLFIFIFSSGIISTLFVCFFLPFCLIFFSFFSFLSFISSFYNYGGVYFVFICIISSFFYLYGVLVFWLIMFSYYTYFLGLLLIMFSYYTYGGAYFIYTFYGISSILSSKI